MRTAYTTRRVEASAKAYPAGRCDERHKPSVTTRTRRSQLTVRRNTSSRSRPRSLRVSETVQDSAKTPERTVRPALDAPITSARLHQTCWPVDQNQRVCAEKCPLTMRPMAKRSGCCRTRRALAGRPPGDRSNTREKRSKSCSSRLPQQETTWTRTRAVAL